MKLPISACLIVKNEEKNLPLLLERVKNLFQEIIIIDTGSTDKTKEIALNYTEKIYDFDWNDNFAEARNFSLSKATQELILCLDADFVFLEKSIIEIEKTIKNTNYDIFNINCIEFDGITHPLSFLFKNHLGIEFIGSIHEQLSYDKKLKKSNSEIYVSHHGYNNQKITLEKSNRNRKIIDTELLEINDALIELRLKIYQFYNDIEINSLSNDEIFFKIKELDEKINNLTHEQIQSRKQLFESFYIFAFNFLNITTSEKIELVKKLLILFPTSLNLLYLFSELLFELNPYGSIKILYLAYYILKTKDSSINHYSIKENLKNEDYIFSKIIEKYKILGDYKALAFWNKNDDFMSKHKDITIDFNSDSVYDYLKIAREFCHLNIYPDKALFFYEKIINATKNEYVLQICYAELLLNADFLGLNEDRKTDLIENLIDFDLEISYTHYCLGKFYKKTDLIEKALEQFEKAFLLELEDKQLFFDQDRCFLAITLKESNSSSYEYLRVINELNILSDEGFL